MNTPHIRRLLALLTAPVALSPLALAQTSGAWNVNNNGNWSATGSWFNSTIADGAGSTADFTQVNLTANRTATIDTTSRTLGTLLIGDSDGTHNYTIAASGGASLIFDNNLSDAVLTQVSNSGANTISAPITLTSNLAATNNSSGLLTFSGVIGGSKSLILASPGSGGVTLSGTSTYTGGTTIKSGTVLANNAAAFGTGTVLLGDTSGSADATLTIGSFTVANAITVQAGSTGKLTLSNTTGGSSARPTGDIVLNNNLTIAANGTRANSNAGALFSASGAISGSGDLTLDVTGNLSTSNNTNSPQMDNLTLTGPVSTTGKISNVGAGTGRAAISGAISNAASVNQDSTNSMLTLSGTNTYAGNTNVKAGILRITTGAALPANNTVNVSSGGTFQLSNSTSTAFGSGTTVNISGEGGSAASGAIETTNSSNYAGAVVLKADSTVSSGLTNSTFTLSGTIAGSGKNLTITGSGNTTISTDIATGSGGISKEGTGLLTLSAANTYTGATTLSQGATLLSNTGALGGGGTITFDGGTLRHSSTNTVDYASRIKNSTGPIALDTNGQNVTYAGNIDSTNTGGLLKTGSARLTLSGTNAFSGPVVVNGGVLAVSATSALPATGTGLIYLDSAGSLNTGGAYADIQTWLNSGNISTASTGAIALTANSNENINFTGYNSLSLGASSNATYTGAITAAGSTYRLGGGGATLTLSGVNALTGTNALAVGNGPVSISASNDMSGATTVASNTLTLSFGGSLANSAVTVQPGATLAITSNTDANPATRAASVALNRGSLTVTGNSVGNSTDIITGALTVGAGGNSIVTLNQANAKNVRLTAGSLAREAGATALIRGTNLGLNTIASLAANASNITFSSTPSLVGGAGANTTDGGIIIGMVGDSNSGGSGFGSTGGLLTYDSTYGLRLLNGSEYKTSINNGQTQLDNVKLSQTASGTATTTLANDTTVNSLSLYTSGATGATISVDGAGKLTLNSGVIYANSVTATTAVTVSNNIDFNGREAVVLAGGSNNLTLSGVLSNTGGKGLTVYVSAGRSVTLSGSSANSYTGLTTVNGGTLALNKTTGVDAITGDILVNSGGALSNSTSNQIADTANVTIDGGSFSYRNETINNLNLTNSGTASNASSNSIALVVNGALSVSNDASLSTASAAATNLTVGGATSLSSGGSITLGRSQSTSGTYDAVTTLNGALNITHKATGDYTAITINNGAGMGQSGAKLILGGDVTFTGNSTNTSTVLIDAIKGSGRQGVIELTAATPGNRTFNIGNGAATTDLRITAALLDGAGGASNLVKAGAGTLALSGANTYSGNTAVNAGALTLDQSGSLTFYIGANGVNNAVTGSGTVTFNGSFNFDFTNAVATGGNSWLIVDTGTLSESFTGTFAITGFTENANVWTNGSGYSFSESTGILTYTAVPEPSTYALLGGVASLLLAAFRRRRTAI
jgi:autotransporter-associated beta strand protein